MVLGMWSVVVATALVGGGSAALTSVGFLMSCETHRFQTLEISSCSLP